MLPFLAKKYPYTPVADEFLVLQWGEGNTLATQCRYGAGDKGLVYNHLYRPS